MSSDPSPSPISTVVDTLYRTESRRVLATLIRLLGDFDLAEDALQEAFAAALVQWPREGVPKNPRAWLVSTGRFKAIDTLRRRARFYASLQGLAEQHAHESTLDDSTIADDRLRLIFTCCHPALPADAQVALTLREVCGLTTDELARAFLTSSTTLAQRIVRAKARIREKKLPYEVPDHAALPERLEAVLRVAYLVFNEGYYASSGAEATRQNLSQEGIRLARLLAELLPQPEVKGLLALMLLQESRRAARTTSDGDLILLDDQDRSLWSQPLIVEGTALVQQALQAGSPGSYTLQAAIAAVHAAAPQARATDWAEIVRLYDQLVVASPSPVVALNRAVAVAMHAGPAAGVALVEALFAQGHLTDYGLAHATHADLCRRLGRTTDARASYQRALILATQEPERRFLEERLLNIP